MLHNLPDSTGHCEGAYSFDSVAVRGKIFSCTRTGFESALNPSEHPSTNPYRVVDHLKCLCFEKDL